MYSEQIKYAKKNEMSQSKLSDPHYRSQNIQPIDIQEQIQDNNKVIPDKPRHLICMSIKHIVRAGLKGDNNPWEKDIHKAINYLFRAITGKWIWEVENLDKYLK